MQDMSFGNIIHQQHRGRVQDSNHKTSLRHLENLTEKELEKILDLASKANR